ncbi:MAG: hypothetical protein HN656_10490, partial [Acidiferrobacteraceae bacterium]|nr:hypothetical protein [Acidiferrobacteraceae bacterium]
MAMFASRSPGWSLPAGYRPGRLLLIAITLLMVGGCESDREELEASNRCVWCRLNGADLAGVDLTGAT